MKPMPYAAELYVRSAPPTQGTVRSRNDDHRQDEGGWIIERDSQHLRESAVRRAPRTRKTASTETPRAWRSYGLR